MLRREPLQRDGLLKDTPHPVPCHPYPQLQRVVRQVEVVNQLQGPLLRQHHGEEALQAYYHHVREQAVVVPCKVQHKLARKKSTIALLVEHLCRVYKGTEAARQDAV